MKIPKEFEDVFHGVELTEDEVRTLHWLVSWERQTVDNLRSAIQKAQATALSTLQTENEKLQAELEQAKAERDAAISDLETIMAYGGGNLDTCQYCKNGQCYARGGTKLCLPQWRGQKED